MYINCEKKGETVYQGTIIVLPFNKAPLRGQSGGPLKDDLPEAGSALQYIPVQEPKNSNKIKVKMVNQNSKHIENIFYSAAHNQKHKRKCI